MKQQQKHIRPARVLFPASLTVALLLMFGQGPLLTSCSEFNKALKSDSLEYKLAVAMKYRDKGQCDRALPLLEELIVLYRATARSEEVNYLHAKCYFETGDFTMAGYYLNNFTRTFPRSAYAEECAFLAAYCHYKNSPTYELDQTDTKTAISQLQLFLVRYPTTALKDSCNAIIDELRLKLEVKDYHAAAQYFRMRNYYAASTAFTAFLRTWPNSRFREDAMFNLLKAEHRLAINSVESKREARLRQAIRSYHNFADAFPQSVNINDANRINVELNTSLANYQKASTP